MVKLDKVKIFAAFLILATAYVLIYTGAKNPINFSPARDSDLRRIDLSIGSDLNITCLINNTGQAGNGEPCINNTNMSSGQYKEPGTEVYDTVQQLGNAHIRGTQTLANPKNKKQMGAGPHGQAGRKPVNTVKQHGKTHVRKPAKPQSKVQKYTGPHGQAPPIPLNTPHQKENVYVMILSYQRSGSSFTGNLLNRNPAAFYVYEPLDAVYSSLYGIPPGWSVPSDITGTTNGSLRKLPDFEVKASVDVISDILECKVNNLPKEVLLNNFWAQFWTDQINLLDFTKCLEQKKVKVGMCQNMYLRRVCPFRFGLSSQKQETCYNFLHKSTQSGMAIKTKYTQCLLLHTQKAESCIPLLQKRCDLAPIRGVKTVRATMEVAKQLLERHHNLKLIHLIRDPRPVLMSRMSHQSFRAVESKKSIISEARFYCNIVYNDIKLRQELAKKYKGRTTEVIYEDLTSNPLNKTQEIYKFLQLPLVDEVKQWLLEHTNSSVTIANAWQTKIPKKDKKQIDELCKEVLNYGQKFWD